MLDSPEDFHPSSTVHSVASSIADLAFDLLSPLLQRMTLLQVTCGWAPTCFCSRNNSATPLKLQFFIKNTVVYQTRRFNYCKKLGKTWKKNLNVVLFFQSYLTRWKYLQLRFSANHNYLYRRGCTERIPHPKKVHFEKSFKTSSTKERPGLEGARNNCRWTVTWATGPRSHRTLNDNGLQAEERHQHDFPSHYCIFQTFWNDLLVFSLTFYCNLQKTQISGVPAGF